MRESLSLNFYRYIYNKMTDSTISFLDGYNSTFISALTSDSPKKPQPAKITAPLLPHQLAVIHAMEEKEHKITNGWKIDDENTAYGNYAFLGESVGVGKSLMILGHIASSKPVTSLSSATDRNHSFFILKKKTPAVSNINLIIVPHTIYKQWFDYIKTQTTLNFVGISTNKDANVEGIDDKLKKCEVILITNTMIHLIAYKNLKFNRIFVDEADSIVLTNISLAYNFIWLVTASWTNLLFNHRYISPNNLTDYSNRPYIHPDCKNNLMSMINNASPHGYINFYQSVRSPSIAHLFENSNSFRFQLLVKCSAEFIKNSTNIPDAAVTTYRCKGLSSQALVQDFIPEEVNQMLHAGDIQGALDKLGVQASNPENLVEAVKLSKKNELEKLDADLKAIHIRIYSDEHIKAAAIKRVEDKIKSLKEQIASFESRVANYKDESCGICYDEPIAPALTPCCSQIFCTECVVKSVKKFKGCPMCRHEPFSIKQMHYLVDVQPTQPAVNTFETDVEPADPILKKDEMLIKILMENPGGKFLIFSRYDNPFATLESRIEKEGITVNQLKGTKNTITSRIKKFSEGKIKALLLNNQYAGAGLNIVAATHIILWHAMTVEEEKQIIGRALRLGRTETVQVIKLLNEGEAGASA